MNIKEHYQVTIDRSIRYEMMTGVAVGWLYAKFEKELPLLEGIVNRVDLGCSGITIYPTNRDECIKVLQIFGGKWDKTPEDYYPDKIRYTRKVDCPFQLSDLAITICQVPPPPSCRVEEVEELVPASIRKVRKIVCPTGDADTDVPTTSDVVITAPSPAPEVEPTTI